MKLYKKPKETIDESIETTDGTIDEKIIDTL